MAATEDACHSGEPVNLPFLMPVGCFDIGLARCFLEAGPKDKMAITKLIERFFS
jgi:hypothetical protein